jgi:putative addiction module component (TIGR02574 family)
MESTESLLKMAMLLRPQERYLLVDGLLRSLDEPDKDIDTIWAEEAERRLAAHRAGGVQGIPFEEVFGEDL